MFERTGLGLGPAPQSHRGPGSGFATPPRSRSRRGSTPARERKPGAERWRISPAPPDRQSVSIEPRVNSAQSPLADDRHHAANRRAARSASPFCPGNASKSSDRSSSIGGGLNDQALKKGIHAMTSDPSLRNLAADDEVETLHDKNRVMDSPSRLPDEFRVSVDGYACCRLAPAARPHGAIAMDNTSTTTASSTLPTKRCSRTTVSDEALEAAAGTARVFTAMVTDCRTLIASCCG